MRTTSRPRGLRFGAFDVDLHSGELYKHGIRLKLQDQPFQVLALLAARPGELVTREELRQTLWPGDSFVDFDTGLNSAIKKLRDVLGDDADEPRYIETLPRRGYRFIAEVENGGPLGPATSDRKQLLVLPSKPAHETTRQRRLAAIVGVVALLVVASVVAWRELTFRPALKETDVILLANFVNRTGDPIFDDSLDKALEVKLTESPFLSLLPEADVRATLAMMRRKPSDRVTEALGIEICKRRGLKAVVVPEIDAVGNTYLITLEAIDAQSGRSIALEQEQARSKDQVIAALGKAGAQLRLQLGESLRSLEKYNTALDLATTSSLEALQAYTTGQVMYRSGKRGQAIVFYEKAIELDPQFCSAYDALGSAYHSIGDEQASHENFARAFELKDRRLTQEENFRTTAFYDSAITGNLDKEIALLDLYRQAYPRSAYAANLLGIAYAMMGRTQDGLREFQWAMNHSPVPSSQYNSNASQALIILGRFDEAKRLLDQWGQQGRLTPFQMTMRYRIAFLEKDAATMDRLTHEASAEDVPWIHLQENLAFYRGDVAKIRSLSASLVGRQEQAHRMENVATELAYHADEEAYLGNYTLARRLCGQAEEAGNSSALGLVKCSRALGGASETTQAEALARKLSELFPEGTFERQVLLPIVRSTIERKRGNARSAVDLLSPAAQYPNVVVFYNRALAYLAGGDPARAIADLETVLKHPGWPEAEVFAPLARLGLAHSYAMQRDREKSRKAYEEFFATWKDADPDIPILRQAKAEYKKLTAMAPNVSSAAAKWQ